MGEKKLFQKISIYNISKIPSGIPFYSLPYKNYKM